MRHVGALLEAKPFHPTRTARNHLRMLAAANDIPDEPGRRGARHGRPRPTWPASKPSTFSLGMGQRLGLAAALLGDPHTLILDEPANGLDPQGIRWMRDLLKALAAEGRSVFVSSHLLSEMALMADELVVIGRGRMIASGPVERLHRRRHATTSVLVRTPAGRRPRGAARWPRRAARSRPPSRASSSSPASTRGEIGDLAFDHRIRLHELAPQTASLEEAFLEPHRGDEEFQAAVSAHPGRPAPGWAMRSPMSDALRYEWARIRTIRSTWWLTGSALARRPADLRPARLGGPPRLLPQRRLRGATSRGSARSWSRSSRPPGRSPAWSVSWSR